MSPRRIPTPCRYPARCPNTTTDRSGYCERHRKQERQEYDRRRGSARSRGYTRAWEKASAAFALENPLCAECLRNGLLTAGQVTDHIIPHKGDMELFWDRSNWQRLCKPCHDEKTAREDGRWGHRQGGKPTVPVTLVCGPPASGKTTYVRDRARRGDLIVDLDAIFVAITGLDWYVKPDALLPFAMEARDALLDRLGRPSDIRHAWVIASGAKHADRERLRQRLNANVVVLEVDPAECHRRLLADERRGDRAEQWMEIVRRWWRDYEPAQGEERVTR